MLVLNLPAFENKKHAGNDRFHVTNWYVMLIVCTCQWPTRKLTLLWSLNTLFFLAMYCFISSLFVFHVVSVNIVNVIFCKQCTTTKNLNLKSEPFPWKRSVWRNPDQERTNQNARISLKTTLPYNKSIYLPWNDSLWGLLGYCSGRCVHCCTSRHV